MRARMNKKKHTSRSSPALVLVWLVIFFLFRLAVRHRGTYNRQQVTRRSHDFQVVILAMNRSSMLRQLLRSLQDTDFSGDHINLDIHFDMGENMDESLEVAHRFHFKHGQKKVSVSKRSHGLAAAWYGALNKSDFDPRIRSIILEDDINLSPLWYVWLKAAWAKYHVLPNIAGISLQRQTLIPYQPFHQQEIVNRHVPFLYTLVGSIGFSPCPLLWNEFLDWVSSTDLRSFDITIPGLVTSDWWKRYDSETIWTQSFIYFCLQREMYTLYINLENQATLAAHLRAKGAHYGSNMGADFKIAENIGMSFPSHVETYDWDGTRLGRSDAHGLTRNPRNILTATSHLQQAVLIEQSKQKLDSNGYVTLVFVTTANVLLVDHFLESVDQSLLGHTIFISNESNTTRWLAALYPSLLFLTVSDVILSPDYLAPNCIGWQNAVTMISGILHAGISVNIINPSLVNTSSTTVPYGSLAEEARIVFEQTYALTPGGARRVCELRSIHTTAYHTLHKYAKKISAQSKCDHNLTRLHELVSSGTLQAKLCQ